MGKVGLHLLNLGKGGLLTGWVLLHDGMYYSFYKYEVNRIKIHEMRAKLNSPFFSPHCNDEGRGVKMSVSISQCLTVTDFQASLEKRLSDQRNNRGNDVKTERICHTSILFIFFGFLD